jgi:leucyl aminopeptidase
MISGNAYRPGDIVRSMSGKTIEINNTDAEGRLILADVMTYIQKKFSPKAMIDLATLTGACRVALGTAYAGLFSDDEEFAADIIKSGKAVQENTWQLPLHEIYNEAMKDSRYADLVNASGIGGGASTAAEFLSEFVDDNVRWAHLDIAAMASGARNHPTRPDIIGNAFGVRLLDRLIADHFEAKPSPVAVLRPIPVP